MFKKNPMKQTKQIIFCWESHKPYVIQCEGKSYEINGGSCTNHYPQNVDIFIGFDNNMIRGKREFPWEKGIDINFHIPDMQSPKDVKQFKKLINWTIEQLTEGKKLYCGCIGGHGRTGLFLAALTTVMTGNKNSIKTVRDNYCKKAVESKEQIDWLHINFGINKIKASKQSYYSTKFNSSNHNDDFWEFSKSGKTSIIDNKNHKAVDGYVSKIQKHKYYCQTGYSCFESVD